jgi:hypothetical protein
MGERADRREERDPTGLATELAEQTFPIPPIAAGTISRHSGKIQTNLNGRKVSLSLHFPGLVTEK